MSKMTVTAMKTKAEQDLARNFEATVGTLPGGGWVADARRAAFGRIAKSGLPSRRVEAWKYTDLKTRMTEALPPQWGKTADALAAGNLESLLGPALAALDCHRLVFVDGCLASPLFSAPGVEVAALSQAIGTAGHDWLQPHLTSSGGELPDFIVQLNTAFAADGGLIRLAPGTSLDKPLHLVFIATSPAQIAMRNVVEVGAGSKLTLIESHVSALSSPRQSSTVSAVAVADGAHVLHLKHVADGRAAQHLGRCDATLGRDATYKVVHLTAATALARHEVVVTFTEPGSVFDFAATTLSGGAEHVDTTLVVDHKVPHCTSRELFKAVLADRARAVFQGKVIVREDAQKTDGKQMAQALMLSEEAEFDSKPELEIYADDVACGHGSTVANLDPDLVFYCQSRGIPETEARALLISSFVGEVIDAIDGEPLREAMSAIAEQWLGTLIR